MNTHRQAQSQTSSASLHTDVQKGMQIELLAHRQMFREAGRHTGSWEDVQIGREINRLSGKGTGSQAERYKSGMQAYGQGERSTCRQAVGLFNIKVEMLLAKKFVQHCQKIFKN
jgi:hypothetical protein